MRNKLENINEKMSDSGTEHPSPNGISTNHINESNAESMDIQITETESQIQCKQNLTDLEAQEDEILKEEEIRKTLELEQQRKEEMDIIKEVESNILEEQKIPSLGRVNAKFHNQMDDEWNINKSTEKAHETSHQQLNPLEVEHSEDTEDHFDNISEPRINTYPDPGFFKKCRKRLSENSYW